MLKLLKQILLSVTLLLTFPAFANVDKEFCYITADTIVSKFGKIPTNELIAFNRAQIAKERETYSDKGYPYILRIEMFNHLVYSYVQKRASYKNRQDDLINSLSLDCELYLIKNS